MKIFILLYALILVCLIVLLPLFPLEDKQKNVINFGNLTGSGRPLSEMTDEQKAWNNGGRFSGQSSNNPTLQGGSGGTTDGKVYYGLAPKKKQKEPTP